MPEDQYLTPDDLLGAPAAAGPAPAAAPAPQPKGWQVALQALVPTLAAIVAGRQGAGLPAVSGYASGLVEAQRYQDQQARFADEQRRRDELLAVQQQRVRQQFVSDFMQALAKAETPEEHEALVRQWAEMAPSVGLNPRRIYGMPFDQTKAEAISRKQWAEGLKPLDIEALIDRGMTPDQLEGSLVTNPITGKRESFRNAWGLAGMPVDAEGRPVLPGPKTAKADAPQPGSFADYMTAPPERRAEILAGRKAYMQADDRPPVSVAVNAQGQEDTETLAQMLVEGAIIPSQMSKRSATYNRTLAVADRMNRERTGKGLDLTKLQTDFNAAQRFVGSMNGAQMIRFKALAHSVVNTIDEVRMLAEQLQQGGVQLWNRAKRDSLLQVYGNTPYSETAVRYIGAVNTLKEEFANLAQGGYAPTEAAWKLANSQINTDFGVKDLSASLNEVQRLINYRIAAFDQMGPISFTPGVGQAPLSPPPAGHGPAAGGDARIGKRVKGKDGRIGTVVGVNPDGTLSVQWEQ